MLTKAQKKYVGVLIKIAVLAFAGWYIYQQLSDPKNLLKFKTLISGIDPHFFWQTLIKLSKQMLAKKNGEIGRASCRERV